MNEVSLSCAIRFSKAFGRTMTPRYTGFDPDGVAATEADHFMKCAP